MSRAARAGLAALLLLAGCATARGPRAPASVPLASGDPRPAADLAFLAHVVAQRRALRARARVALDGPSGSSSAHQILLVERPARLRVEVLGLLGQRVAILATDGRRYDLYRSGSSALEQGLMRPSILWEVAGVPLTPEAAVRLLLAAPPPPRDADPPRARVDSAGGIHLRWPDATLEFDAGGRLRRYQLQRGTAGSTLLDARFDDYGEVDGQAFPRRLRLDFPASKTTVEVSYQDVELNPTLSPQLFELRPLATPSRGGAEGRE